MTVGTFTVSHTNIASARVHYDEGVGMITYAVVPAEENLDVLPDIMLQQDGIDC